MQAATAHDYKSLYEQSQLELLQMKQQLQQLQKINFGSKHERFVPLEINTAQLSLGIHTVYVFKTKSPLCFEHIQYKQDELPLKIFAKDADSLSPFTGYLNKK